MHTFGCYLISADILERKYYKVCPSDFGDGACAATEIPSGTIYGNYGGHRLSEIERDKKFQKHMEIVLEREKSGNYTEEELMDYKEQYEMYRYGLIHKSIMSLFQPREVMEEPQFLYCVFQLKNANRQM